MHTYCFYVCRHLIINMPETLVSGHGCAQKKKKKEKNEIYTLTFEEVVINSLCAGRLPGFFEVRTSE